jgi:hypothetical protein
LIAGTTSIVGLPGTSAACFGSLARSVDVAQNGLGADRIRTSAIFPPSRSTVDGVCAGYANDVTDAFLIHCGEGTSASMRNELNTLRTLPTIDDCLLSPRTTITHGTAFFPEDFALLASAGVNLTWSPRSNFFLYGQTTDIVSARDAGVSISIAPDWSLGGSQNMLDELAFAAALDDDEFGDAFSDLDFFEMATSNAALALDLSERMGTLEAEKLADIAVFARVPGQDPYTTVVQAKPNTVRLVMVGGVVLYGDMQLTAAAPQAPGCETIDICGVDKFLCVATTSTANKLNQTYADIRGILEDAFAVVDAVRPDVDGQPFVAPTPLVRCPG